AVVRALASDAAFFPAAERRDFGRGDSLVDADDAVLERLGDTPTAAKVAGEEIGSKAERCVVGHAHRFLFRLEAEQGRDGAKRLLARDAHLLRHASEHGRLVEVAAERGRLAATTR